MGYGLAPKDAMAAAASPKPVTCSSCGFKNPPNPKGGRCGSCGASFDRVSLTPSRPSGEINRYQQEGFSLTWMLIGLGIQAILTTAIVIGLPMVVPIFDFEGWHGMLVSIAVWFLGGLLTGLISPGKTFVEPFVATILVAIPAVIYLIDSQTVRTMPSFMYVIMAALGVLFGLIGAYTGERIQMGPPPKPRTT